MLLKPINRKKNKNKQNKKRNKENEFQCKKKT